MTELVVLRPLMNVAETERQLHDVSFYKVREKRHLAKEKKSLPEKSKQHPTNQKENKNPPVLCLPRISEKQLQQLHYAILKPEFLAHRLFP